MIRLLRIPLILLLVAGLLGSGYYWAYTTSSMGWDTSTRIPYLRVMGMNLSYTEKSGRRFTRFFKPLIDRDYNKSAVTRVEGTFSSTQPDGKFILNRPGKMGIQIHYGPEHAAFIQGLQRDAPLKIGYKQKRQPENPFSYVYQLTEISGR